MSPTHGRDDTVRQGDMRCERPSASRSATVGSLWGSSRPTQLRSGAPLGTLMRSGASSRPSCEPLNIGGSVYTPLATSRRIEASFQTIIDKAGQIAEPFETSFLPIACIPYLQPFEDVNERVSRLGANIPPIKNNLSPLSFIDMPEEPYFRGTRAIYEFNRTENCWPMSTSTPMSAPASATPRS